MKISSKVVTLFLCLVVSAVMGQDAPPEHQEQAHHQEQQPPPPASCNCDEISQAHQKCVNDWTILDQLRQTLEQQVRDTEWHANERCNTEKEQVRGEVQAQLEQIRGENQAQVEQARNEGRAQLDQFRSESQRNLEVAVNEGNTKLEEVQRQAQADLTQCQSQHQELNAQFEEQGSTHRRLQESSRQLEETLATVKSEKSKLEKSLSDKEMSLTKEKKQKKQVQRELDETKKTLAEMIAARTIITIDYDLLNERIEEIKTKIKELTSDFMAVVGEHLRMAKEKLMEFYEYLEKEVYPQVKKVIDEDVIPFVKKTWKQATDMWEEIYSPYRPQVNKQIKTAKKEWKNFYKQNLEPSVKEYKLDEHAATAKKTAEDYMTLAHNHLVDGVETSTRVAGDFLKLEDGPEFAIDAMEKLHTNHEKVAFYIECFFAFLVVRFILKMLFKKKKIKKSAKKQAWKEREAAKAAAAGKGKQQPQGKNNANNNNKAKNGHKNSKKNK